MSAFDDAWVVLKQSFHPAIHGLMRRKRIADEFGPGYQPSDFVEEAYGDYEPKGAAERDPDDPNTLDAMEAYGTLVRQSNPGAQDPANMEGVLDNIRRRKLYAQRMLAGLQEMGKPEGVGLTEREIDAFGPDRVLEGDY